MISGEFDGGLLSLYSPPASNSVEIHTDSVGFGRRLLESTLCALTHMYRERNYGNMGMSEHGQWTEVESRVKSHTEAMIVESIAEWKLKSMVESTTEGINVALSFAMAPSSAGIH